MKTITTLLIGLLFISCTGQDKFVYECSQDLRPYLYEYLATLEKHDIKFKKQNFILVFDSDIMKTNMLGLARGMNNDNLVYVKINPKGWFELTEKQKRHLVFHELSHDIFNIKHTQDIELMRPSMATVKASMNMNIDNEIITLMSYIKVTKQ
tara:strand:- start:333 stop:788 length:456 start_codon:yes stop_codon:yes gene_type:complete